MSVLRPQVPPLLDDGQLHRIHRAALATIERVGMYCDRPDVLDRLHAMPNVRVESGRVFLRAEDCARMIDAQIARLPVPPEPEGPISIYAGLHAHHILDFETDELRPITLADGIEGAKLIDALHDRRVFGGCPGAPTDVAPGLREVAQAITSARYCRTGPAAVITSLASARFMREIRALFGQGFSTGIHVVSPMRLEGDEFHIALAFLDDERVGISVGGMPMIGATAPVHIIGCLVVAIAEVLATVCILKLLTREDRDFGFTIDAYAVDMHTGSIVFSCPEQQLVELLRRDINRFYRATKVTRSLKTHAKRIGPQMGLEIGAGLSAGALMGSRGFTTGMSLDEVFSAEKLIFDCEARDWAERLQRGVRFDEETLTVELIAETLAEDPRGNFLAHPSTAEHFRETYWLPWLLDRNLLAGADLGPLEQSRQRARAEVGRLIASHDFELDADRERALSAIYADAEAFYRRGGNRP